MKDAYDWTISEPKLYDIPMSVIRAIQLDAICHGMTLAAETAFQNLDFHGGELRPSELRDAILTARDNFQLP